MGRSSIEGVHSSAFSLSAIVKGTLLAFAVTLLSAILLGIAVSLTEWEGLSRGLDGFTYVGIALGGMMAAKQSQRFGWLHGGTVGFIYYLFSSLLFVGDFSIQTVTSAAWLAGTGWSVVAGAVGGVLGVNT